MMYRAKGCKHSDGVRCTTETCGEHNEIELCGIMCYTFQTAGKIIHGECPFFGRMHRSPSLRTQGFRDQNRGKISLTQADLPHRIKGPNFLLIFVKKLYFRIET